MCNDSSSSCNNNSSNNNNKGNVTTAGTGMGIEIEIEIGIEIEVYHRTAVTTFNAGIRNCRGRGKGKDSGLGIKTSQHRISKIRGGISRMKEGINRMKEGINRIRDKDRDDMMRSLSTNKAPNSIRDLGKMTRLTEIEITGETARWAMIGNKGMIDNRAMIDNKAGTGSKAMTGTGVSIDSRAAIKGTCKDLQTSIRPIEVVEVVGDLLREEDQAA